MPETYIERILRARVYDVARESPLTPACLLSRRLDHQVLLKREDLQPVFSFKLRGTRNKLAHLDARALLQGDSYDEAYAHAMGLVAERGLTFIHPFDDPDVIAGQGTIGMEILRQIPEPPHAIFAPVGGGGLIAGIGAYVKYVHPEVRVIGVEPEDAPTLERALRAGRPVELEHPLPLPQSRCRLRSGASGDPGRPRGAPGAARAAGRAGISALGGDREPGVSVVRE